MTRISPLIDRLIEALQVLPGVGPKSATRMALYLLQRNRGGASVLAEALQTAADEVAQCTQCRNLCESPVCAICASAKRDPATLCVVESPADVVAIPSIGERRPCSTK